MVRAEIEGLGALRGPPDKFERSLLMKRLILTIAAVASVAGPMVMMATDAAAQDRGDRGYSQRDNRGDNRGDYRNDNRGGRQDYRNDNRNDRYDRNDRNGGRYDNRGGYSQQRWD